MGSAIESKSPGRVGSRLTRDAEIASGLTVPIDPVLDRSRESVARMKAGKSRAAPKPVRYDQTYPGSIIAIATHSQLMHDIDPSPEKPHGSDPFRRYGRRLPRDEVASELGGARVSDCRSQLGRGVRRDYDPFPAFIDDLDAAARVARPSPSTSSWPWWLKQRRGRSRSTLRAATPALMTKCSWCSRLCWRNRDAWMWRSAAYAG